jgi:hypothetical protein
MIYFYQSEISPVSGIIDNLGLNSSSAAAAGGLKEGKFIDKPDAFLRRSGAFETDDAEGAISAGGFKVDKFIDKPFAFFPTTDTGADARAEAEAEEAIPTLIRGAGFLDFLSFSPNTDADADATTMTGARD